MKLRILAAVAALSLAATGISYAADGKVVATLKTPVAAKTKVVAAGAVFSCEGTTCIALTAPARADTSKGCKALSKEVGVLASYGTLDLDDQAKCGIDRSSTQQAAN